MRSMSSTTRLDDSVIEADRLLAVVAATLDIDASDVHLDTDLLATGRLDSLAIVTLVAYLEDELGLKLAVDEIVPENFSCVRRIAELVERARG